MNFLNEPKRTCELEAKSVNIECFGRFIRSSQVHVPLSLTVPVSCSEYR